MLSSYCSVEVRASRSEKVASLTWRRGNGHSRRLRQRHFGSRSVFITSRGFGGTTPASHADGATAMGIDFSNIENCIADVTRIASTYGTKSGNIKNAAYAAL
jgi:hypothetical protein